MTKALTPARRARLEKLAAYLESLPADYSHFRMELYCIARGEDDEATYARKNGGFKDCGTVACAIGHGPAAGILVPRRFVFDNNVDWSGYEDELFTGHGDDSYALHAWMFAGCWESIDNHHYGAAARIRYLLEHGKPPKDYDASPKRKHRALYAPYRIDAKAPANA